MCTLTSRSWDIVTYFVFVCTHVVRRVYMKLAIMLKVVGGV